jgi:hypothetical protein
MGAPREISGKACSTYSTRNAPTYGLRPSSREDPESSLASRMAAGSNRTAATNHVRGPREASEHPTCEVLGRVLKNAWRLGCEFFSCVWRLCPGKRLHAHGNHTCKGVSVLTSV